MALTLKVSLWISFIKFNFVIYLWIWLIYGKTYTYNQTYMSRNFDMTLTFIWPWLIRSDFFYFALIIITFLFMYGFNSYIDKTTLVTWLTCLMILIWPLIWPWPTSGFPFMNNKVKWCSWYVVALYQIFTNSVEKND